MMKCQVKLFARARDLAGTSLACVEIPEGATVARLRLVLGQSYPALAPLLERCAIAVGNEFVEDGCLVTPEAEVALLPPVSGGAPAGEGSETER